MIKALIVDNEEHFTISFSEILEVKFPFIEIIGIANNIATAVNIINESDPDLVFLDIEMENEKGFDLFKYFNKTKFSVIFVSSHDEYAVKAIKYAAFDYILKPIDTVELASALERFRNKQIHDISNAETISLLLENLHSGNFRKIAFPTVKGISILPIDQIIRCMADGCYAHVFLSNEKKMTITKPLKEIEEMLPSSTFIRTHKSHLININYISEYSNKDGGIIIMTDGSEIVVALRKKDFITDFLRQLNKFNYPLR